MIATFDRFTVEMSRNAVLDCSHRGECFGDCLEWSKYIVRPPLATPEAVADELREYGAWDAEELSNDRDNWLRIIWIAAGNIKEEARREETRGFTYAD